MNAAKLAKVIEVLMSDDLAAHRAAFVLLIARPNSEGGSQVEQFTTLGKEALRELLTEYLEKLPK